jgi:hypothetical protein
MDPREMLETIKSLEARLEEAVAEVDELMSEMAVDTDLDKQEVFTFIRNLQLAGMGSMALEYIQRRFNVNEATAESYLFDFVDSHGPTPVVQQQAVKKPRAVNQPQALNQPETVEAPVPLQQKKANSKGLLAWNAFMEMTRTEMEAEGLEHLTYNAVKKRALDAKQQDPESYRLFVESLNA